MANPDTLLLEDLAKENTTSLPSINSIGEDNASPCAANSVERIKHLLKYREEREVLQQQEIAKSQKKYEACIKESPIIKFFFFNFPIVRAIMVKDYPKSMYKRVTKRELSTLRHLMEENLGTQFKWKQRSGRVNMIGEMLLRIELYV